MEKQEIKELLEKETGFFKHNNFQFIDCIEGKSAELKVILNDNSYNPYKIAHGGLLFGLGDHAMGIVASSTGRNVVTLNSTINYLKPAKGKYLIAKAEMIKNGKNTCFLRCNIYNDKEEVVTTMDGNYYYID